MLNSLLKMFNEQFVDNKMNNLDLFQPLRKALIRTVLRYLSYLLNYAFAENKIIDKGFLQNSTDYLRFEIFSTSSTVNLTKQVIEVDT